MKNGKQVSRQENTVTNISYQSQNSAQAPNISLGPKLSILIKSLLVSWRLNIQECECALPGLDFFFEKCKLGVNDRQKQEWHSLCFLFESTEQKREGKNTYGTKIASP